MLELLRPMRGIAALPLALLLSAHAHEPSWRHRADLDGDPPSGTFAVRCGTLFDGRNAPIHDCWLVVRDGKVAEILRTVEGPRDLPVVDASDRVVMPGIVAADTDFSGQGDDDYNVTPDLCALDGFDFDAPQRRALAAGITTAYLSPGRNRLISGQGSVVKLAGEDLVARVIAESACLRINLSESSTQAPAIFEPTYFPTADDPLVPATRQVPTARISQLAVLRQLFAEALRDDGPIGSGPTESRYDAAPLRAAARGDLPIRLAARTAAEVQRALAFGEQLGQRVIIEDPAEIEPIADLLKARGARIVFRMPVQLSMNNPGGENRRDRRALSTPENLAFAARAGVPVALAPANDDSLDDVLLLAGLAVRHGLTHTAAIASITSVAADVLGVGERIGALETGRDADFIILSGDPLAVGTMVEETWIDGARCYERHPAKELLAIRCARIVTADGLSLRDGVVIIADGRIKAVGEDLAIPFGARVLDLRDQGGVMVPGFIDSDSHLGLAGDGIGVLAGNPGQRVADAVRHDDPAFQNAIAAGITTVMVSGNDGAFVSGRVAALKTGAADATSMVLDPIAGLRIVFDDLAPDAVNRIAAELDKGKKYLESWQAYEKAVADWKAGTAKKPDEAAPEPADGKPADDGITGVWTCEMTVQPMGLTIKITLDLKLAGTAVTGTAGLEIRDRQLPPQNIENGKFENGELRLALQMMGNASEMVAKIEADKLTGKVTAMGQEVDVTGTRTSKAGEAKATPTAAGTATDGTPKKPKVEQALESLRELVEGKATAVVRTTRAPAIQAVIKLLTERKIRFALQDVDDAIDSPALLGSSPPPIILGPELVDRVKGEVVNRPSRLVDAGVSVAFATGDSNGTRWLPVHAMHSIRWGLDSMSALRAITIEAAKIYGVDDRVGSIERGKDADLVIFSGGPFEPTSRLLLVVCNGRVVLDARKESR